MRPPCSFCGEPNRVPETSPLCLACRGCDWAHNEPPAPVRSGSQSDTSAGAIATGTATGGGQTAQCVENPREDLASNSPARPERTEP